MCTRTGNDIKICLQIVMQLVTNHVKSSFTCSANSSGQGRICVPRQLPSSHDAVSPGFFETSTWYNKMHVLTATDASLSAISLQKAHRTLVIPSCMMALHPLLVNLSELPGFSTTTAATQICCRSRTRDKDTNGTSGYVLGSSDHGKVSTLAMMTCTPQTPLRRRW